MYEVCENGNTPLIVAYRAGVDDEIIRSIFRLVGMHAIIKTFNLRNIYDETFPTLFLRRYGAGSRLSFNIDVSIFIGIITESMQEQTVQSPDLADLCNTLWWQELELENVSIKNKNINTNNLYDFCNDEDTPLMVAYRAGVSDKTITDILELAAIHDIIELLDAKNTDGKSLREMILEEHNSELEYNLFLFVEVPPLTVRSG